MKILITGITGFVGSHLVDYVRREHPKVEIFGLRRTRSIMKNLDHVVGQVTLRECDIKDPHNIHQVIDEIRPDKIFHLAAQSFVPSSWKAPTETYITNIIGQANLFETVRVLRSENFNPVIQIAGSSEEYGKVRPQEVPVTEDNPLRPLSPYAVSKVTQDLMGYQYWESYGLRVIRTRAFNHSGPRRGEHYVDSNFAKQIAEIEFGLRKKVIEVGNLEAVRDFSDVRDIVRGYWLLTEKGQLGEVYNICSGQGLTIQKVLDTLLRLSTVSDIEVRQDPARMRPSDVPIMVGNATRMKTATNWEPSYSYLEHTLRDTLDYWRQLVKNRSQRVEE